MLELDAIRDEPTQQMNFPVEGSSIEGELILYWKDTQTSWFVDVSYDQFSVKQIRLCFSPNILNQFVNQIPFGIFCETTNKQDPFSQQSFTDGICKLYILSQDEAKGLEAEFG